MTNNKLIEMKSKLLIFGFVVVFVLIDLGSFVSALYVDMKDVLDTPIRYVDFKEAFIQEKEANKKLIRENIGYEYVGFIIELEERPLLERLDTKNKLLTTKKPFQKQDIKKAESSIENEHIIIKEKISSKLKKVIETREDPNTIKLIAEYKNSFNGIALKISKEDVEKIKDMKGIKRIYPNYKVYVNLMDSIPLIKVDDVWSLGYTGKGVSIAIVDTGVDYTHPDLGGCFGTGCKVAGGYDFVNDDSDPIDDNGHGTHVAGIAAGKGILNGIAPDAKIYAYKVLNQRGEGTQANILEAIEKAVDPNSDGDFSDKIDIISISLGSFGFPDDPVSQAVDRAVRLGSVVVVSAGNSGPAHKTVGSPGTARKALTVGATYKKDYTEKIGLDETPRKNDVTYFSSRGYSFNEYYPVGIKPDIVAPGAIICSLRYNKIFPDCTTFSDEDSCHANDHCWWENNECKGLCGPCLDENHVQMLGTSMSTPMVAGVVALIKQKYPNLSSEKIKALVMNYGIDLNYDFNSQGIGRIDPLSSITSPIIATPASISFEGLKFNKVKNQNIVLDNLGSSFVPVTLEIINNDPRIEVVLERQRLTLAPNGEHRIKLFVKQIQNNPPYFRDSYFKIKVSYGNESFFIPVLYYLTPKDGVIGGFNYGYGNIIYENDLPSQIPFFQYLSSADFDNDGDADIVAAVRASLALLSNKGDKEFSSLKIIFVASGRSSENLIYIDDNIHSAAADFDNDGKVDLVTGGIQGIVRILTNHVGESREEKIVTLSEGESYVFQEAECYVNEIFPQTNHIELICKPFSDYPDAICMNLLGKDKTSMCETMTYTLLDIQESSATIKFRAGDFSSRIIQKFGQTAYGPFTGDFDNDGDVDFMIAYSDGGKINLKIELFENDGTGNFDQHETIYSRHGTRATDLAAGDFDNDGDIDILVSYGITDYSPLGGDFFVDFSVVDLLKNNGAGNFDEVEGEIIKRGIITQGFVPADHRINAYLTIGDYDSDGDIDLITGDNSGIVEYYENNGNGEFESKGIIFDFGRLSWALTSNDFNNDGSIDLVVGPLDNLYYAKLHLLTNIGGLECTDSDNGKNIYVRGTCIDSNSKDTDYCIGSTLAEYYCENNECKEELINCSSGCTEGACISEKCIKGDATHNGKIDCTDAHWILDMYVGKRTIDLECGDVSGDGEVTAYDATLLMKDPNYLGATGDVNHDDSLGCEDKEWILDMAVGKRPIDIICGDISGDGNVTPYDAALLMQNPDYDCPGEVPIISIKEILDNYEKFENKQVSIKGSVKKTTCVEISEMLEDEVEESMSISSTPTGQIVKSENLLIIPEHALRPSLREEHLKKTESTKRPIKIVQSEIGEQDTQREIQKSGEEPIPTREKVIQIGREKNVSREIETIKPIISKFREEAVKHCFPFKICDNTGCIGITEIGASTFGREVTIDGIVKVRRTAGKILPYIQVIDEVRRGMKPIEINIISQTLPKLIKELESTKLSITKPQHKDWVTYAEIQISNTIKSVEDFEKEPGERGLLYSISWLFGGQTEQENKDAEFLEDKAMNIRSSLEILIKISEQTENTDIKNKIKQQTLLLEEQYHDLIKKAEGKRKNAGGLLSWVGVIR